MMDLDLHVLVKVVLFNTKNIFQNSSLKFFCTIFKILAFSFSCLLGEI